MKSHHALLLGIAAVVCALINVAALVHEVESARVPGKLNKAYENPALALSVKVCEDGGGVPLGEIGGKVRCLHPGASK